MKTTLYLARHGQTKWNKVHRFQGQLDSDLTQTGQQQSEQLALHLAPQKIDLIVSSTLGRSVDSALICQQILDIPVTHVNELMERNLGPWQGQYIADIKSDKNYHEILHQFTEVSPPSGESAVSCGSRIYQALKTLANNHLNKNILVIFHGEALRCFLAKLGHNSSENAYELFDNACLLPLTYQHDDDSFLLAR
jgi:broad specificity phosphatase PhoE